MGSSLYMSVRRHRGDHRGGGLLGLAAVAVFGAAGVGVAQDGGTAPGSRFVSSPTIAGPVFGGPAFGGPAFGRVGLFGSGYSRVRVTGPGGTRVFFPGVGCGTGYGFGYGLGYGTGLGFAPGPGFRYRVGDGPWFSSAYWAVSPFSGLPVDGTWTPSTVPLDPNVAPVAAAAAQRVAVELSPWEQAFALLADGASEEAAAAFEAWLAEEPTDTESVRGYAMALLGSADAMRAVGPLRMAYERTPDLGITPLSVDDVGGSLEARRLLRRAVGVANDFESGSAWLTAAVLAQAEGRDGVALRFLDRAEGLGVEGRVTAYLRRALGDEPAGEAVAEQAGVADEASSNAAAEAESLP